MPTPHRTVAAALAAALLLGGNTPASAATVPHCPTEDTGTNCTWNVRPGVDGNGLGVPFYRDHHSRIHYAPTCATILRTAAYEFPNKAKAAHHRCRANAEILGIADPVTAAVVQRWHWRYVGRFAGRRFVWAMPGATTVYVKRGWFTTVAGSDF